MIEKVEILLKHDIREVVKSPELCMSLIRCYSKMYTYGQQIGTCESSLRKYHETLKRTGIMKAKEFEEIEKRTLIPNWTGLIYSSALCSHISDKLITDSKAVDYLEKGILTEKHFKKLPESYKKEIFSEYIEKTPQPKIKKRLSKNK